MVSLVSAFAPLFSDRVFQHAQTLVWGAILAPSKRTVTAALRCMGLKNDKRWTNYHRVLNRAVWSSLAAAKILLGLILILVPVSSPIVLGADDTLERRKGKKIKAKGCYRDAVRSSKKHVIRCFGLKWVAMMVLVPVPFSKRVWACPFLTALSRPEDKSTGDKNKTAKQKRLSARKRRHKSSVDLVRQMMKLVRRWLPDRVIVLVLDGSFAAVSLALACVDSHVVMVCRMRLDASLYHKPASRPKGKRGPKPKKGKRCRSLKDWASRSDTPWEDIEIDWYRQQRKKLKVFSRTALWYRPGLPPVEIRYVLVRDPIGKLRDEAFFSTKLDATPIEILQWVVQRWSVEVTFEEAREHLGLETQRQWSDLAIERTTPVLLGLYSIVTILAMRLSQNAEIPIERTAWYKKEEATFSDCIWIVRSRIWEAKYLEKSAKEAELMQFPREALDLLIYGLPLAA